MKLSINILVFVVSYCIFIVDVSAGYVSPYSYSWGYHYPAPSYKQYNPYSYQNQAVKQLNNLPQSKIKEPLASVKLLTSEDESLGRENLQMLKHGFNVVKNKAVEKVQNIDVDDVKINLKSNLPSIGDKYSVLKYKVNNPIPSTSELKVAKHRLANLNRKYIKKLKSIKLNRYTYKKIHLPQVKKRCRKLISKIKEKYSDLKDSPKLQLYLLNAKSNLPILKYSLTKKINGLKSKLPEVKLKSYNKLNNIKANLPTLKYAVSNKVDDLKSKLPGVKLKINKKLKNIEAKLPVLKYSISNKINDLKYKLPGLKLKINNKLKNIKANIPVFKYSISNKISDLKSKLPLVKLNMYIKLKSIEASLPALKYSVSNKISDLKSKLPGVKLKINNKLKNIKANIPVLKYSISNKLSDLKSKLPEVKLTMYNKLKSIEANLPTLKQKAAIKLNNALSTSLIVKHQMASKLNKLKYRLPEIKLKAYTKLNNIKIQLPTIKTNLSKKINNIKVNHLPGLKNIVNEKINNAKVTLPILKKNALINLSKVQAELPTIKYNIVQKLKLLKAQAPIVINKNAKSLSLKAQSLKRHLYSDAIEFQMSKRKRDIQRFRNQRSLEQQIKEVLKGNPIDVNDMKYLRNSYEKFQSPISTIINNKKIATVLKRLADKESLTAKAAIIAYAFGY